MRRSDREVVGGILAETSLPAMKEVARRHGLLTGEGRIDLRARKVRFRHASLDLREFLLDGCDLSGSHLVNCNGEDASFRGCILERVHIEAVKATKVSFRNANFDGARLSDAYLGPRTCDLTSSSYRAANLTNVTFMLPRLEAADFSEAVLADVYFRSGRLAGTSFRGARLTRVSFEQASLVGADFTGATFDQMALWGEPDYEGAVIEDRLRYRFGLVKQPRRRVDALIASGALGDEATAALCRLRDEFAELLSHPEAMLIDDELRSAVASDLFPTILRALKAVPDRAGRD